jgi:hypothetical protein
MEQYLLVFTSYQQDDWVRWLALEEFAVNNAPSEATNCSPFFAVMGMEPRMTLGEVDQESADLRVIDADQVQKRMNQIYEHFQVEMRQSQDIMDEVANRKRLPARRISEGTQVSLDTLHIRTMRPSRKLDLKRLGPYTVKQKVSPYAYESELPKGLRIHPVHHVSLLDPVAGGYPPSPGGSGRGSGISGVTG